MIRATVAIAVLFAAVGAAGNAAASPAGSESTSSLAHDVIVFPSPAFRDLQAAIDAAPDGATIKISAGVYEVREPLIVSGKRLVIEGTGSGLDRGGRLSDRVPAGEMTHLVGPAPRPVTDDRGKLVLLADAVRGLLNGVGADLAVQGLRMSGFDAGIVTRDGGDRQSGPLVVRDVFISDTGRGILIRSTAGGHVADSRIENTEWNGISVAGTGRADLATLKDLYIAGPDGAGIYLAEDTYTLLVGVQVIGAQNGGIVAFKSEAHVLDSFLAYNRKAGIMLFEALGTPLIKGNSIGATGSTLPDGYWGDGLVAHGSDVTAVDNFIIDSERSSVTAIGSVIRLGDNQIQCSAFDLNYEEYEGVVGSFPNLGGNVCSCPPIGAHLCQAVSSKLYPPDALEGQE